MANLAFGRRLKVTIYSPDLNSETDAVVIESNLMEGKRGLKIEGSATSYFAIQPPEAVVNIYNLSPLEVANILSLRMKKVGNKFVERPLRIRIEAGYRNSLFGVIFDGQILKPNMVKPDPNNTILRLTCIDGADFVAAGSALTQTFNDGVNYYDVAQQVIKQGNPNVNVYVSEELKNYKVDGSFVSKTSGHATFEAIAEDTGVIYSFRGGKAYLESLEKMMNRQQDAFVLNYQTGLIGFPSLSTDGITVQSVLNPNLEILGLIRLNNADITIDQPDYLANREIGAWLSEDGLYRIIEMTHQFDTTTGAFTSNCKCLARNSNTILGS